MNCAFPATKFDISHVEITCNDNVMILFNCDTRFEQLISAIIKRSIDDYGNFGLKC